MLSTFVYSALFGGLFAVLVVLYSVEDAKGGRVILGGLRRRLDKVVEFVAEHLIKGGIRIAVWTLDFVLEHGIKRLMGSLLGAGQSLEKKIEKLIRQHGRLQGRTDSNRERNHLDDIADHKQESALTERQKSKLRQH